MITTTITCDKCGKDITDRNLQKWHVRVQYTCDKSCVYGTSSITGELQWCRSCFERTGLVPAIETKVTKEERMSLEDLIREIVREEVQT